MQVKWITPIAVVAAIALSLVLAAPGYGANPIVVGETPRLFGAGDFDPATDCLTTGGAVCQELLADRDDPAGPRLRAFVGMPACAPGCPPAPTGSAYGLTTFDLVGPIQNKGDLDSLNATLTVKGKSRYTLFNGGLPPAGACYSQVRIKVKLTVGPSVQERTVEDETLSGSCGNEVEDALLTSFSETFSNVHFRKGESFRLAIEGEAFAESSAALGVASSKADFDVYVEEARIEFPPDPYFSMVPTPGGYSELIAHLPDFAPPTRPFFVLGPIFTVSSLNNFDGQVTLSSPYCTAAGAGFSFSVCPEPQKVYLAPGSANISARVDFYHLNSVKASVMSVPFEAMVVGAGGKQVRDFKVTFTGKGCAKAYWLSTEAQVCPPKAPAKITICHKGKTKKVTKKTFGKLRNHGAKRGACKPKKGR